MKWSEVVKDNALVAAFLAISAVGVSFALGGLIWGFYTLYLCVFLGLFIFRVERTRRTRKAAGPIQTVPGYVVLPDIARRVSKPDKQLIDALGALANSDTARTRAALEAWVNRAAKPDEQLGRQAQMFYRLYRAGDPTQLGRLKALYEANPNSATH